MEFLGPRALYLHSQSNLIFAKDEKLDTLDKGLYIKNYVKENIPKKEDLLGAAFYHRNVTQNYQFCYGLTKYLQSESLNNYDSDYLSAITYKDLNLRNNRTTMQKDLASKYPESTYIQQEYLNKQLSETRIASTFLKIFSMKEIAEKFIQVSSGKEFALPHVYLQLAEGSLNNSEVILAFNLCVELEKLLKENPQIAKNFPINRFYYTFALVSSHLNYTNKYSAIYAHLLGKYPNSPWTLLLKRRVEWEKRRN